jgi:hypothetical protein
LKAKRSSKALRTRMEPPPSSKTVERLTRKIWKFSEELRVLAMAAEVTG